MFYEKREDGTFEFYTLKGGFGSHYLKKTDFFKCYMDFFSRASEIWICSKFMDGELIGYVLGFYIKQPDESLEDIEVVLRASSGKPRVFKTIDTAFLFLLKEGYDSAVINFG